MSAKQFEVREARTTGSLVKGVRRRFWGKRAFGEEGAGVPARRGFRCPRRVDTDRGGAGMTLDDHGIAAMQSAFATEGPVLWSRPESPTEASLWVEGMACLGERD